MPEQPVNRGASPRMRRGRRSRAAEAVRVFGLRAARPVDPTSAAAFRVAFGLMVTFGAFRYLSHGWVRELLLEPDRHFTYPGFGWVTPLPGFAMHALVVLIVALGVCVAAGYRYRLAITGLFVAFTYVELIDRTLYLNHYYWVSVVALAMCVLPLGRAPGLDRRAGRARGELPVGAIWVLRTLVGMVYVFAGIAKLNPDWLLRGQPLAIWLPQDSDLPIIGSFLAAPATALAISWITVMFELAVVPLLLWARTRSYAYAIVVAFHFGTWVVLPEIGMFPLLMSAAVPIFFNPGWPRRVAARFSRTRQWATWHPEPGNRRSRLTGGRAAAGFLVALLAAQVVVPFRHLLYPGDVRWTEEGYRLSWRVMLTEKVGDATFVARDPATGREWRVDPARYLTPLQERAMSVQPEMIRDVAGWIRDDLAGQGHREVEVRARVAVSINGRAAAPLIDPSVDLAGTPAWSGHRRWILQEPWRRSDDRSWQASAPG